MTLRCMGKQERNLLAPNLRGALERTPKAEDVWSGEGTSPGHDTKTTIEAHPDRRGDSRRDGHPGLSAQNEPHAIAKYSPGVKVVWLR